MKMTGDGIVTEFAAGELLSGVSRASAARLNAAYPPIPRDRDGGDAAAPFFRAPQPPHQEASGPDARVCITSIRIPNPPTGTRNTLRRPGSSADPGITLVYYLYLQAGEPSTRLVNAMVTFSFPEGITIPGFSPEKKTVISGIAEAPGDWVHISPAREFSALPALPEGEALVPLALPVGPGETVTAVFLPGGGLALNPPKPSLLEYEGMRRSSREVSYEIFPPMPPRNANPPNRGLHAVFSVTMRVPAGSRPLTSIRIEGKVKGRIWGIVPVQGTLVLPGRNIAPFP